MAHVLAIQKEAAGGQRIIVAAGPWKWQDWRKFTPSERAERHLTNILLPVNAARTINDKLPVGNGAYDAGKVVHYITYSSTKSKDILGLKFRTLKETTKDMMSEFQEQGLLP